MFLILVLALFSATSSFAGAGSTGGGHIVSCPKSVIAEKELILLDLYEARQQGFELMNSSGSITEDYYNSVDNTYTLQGKPDWAEEHRNAILEDFKKMLLNIKFVNAEHLVPFSDDIGVKPWVPSQCRIKQIAHFNHNARTIYINEKLWKQLDSLNQAALIRHEFYGDHYRTLNSTTTEIVRKLVGHSFIATEQLVPIRDGLTSGSREMRVEASFNNEIINSKVFLTEYKASKKIRFQFTSLFGRIFLAKSWADFNFESKLDMQFMWNNFDPELPQMMCILTTPKVNQTLSAKLKGSMSDDYDTLKLHLRTGSQIKLTLYRNGRKVMSGFLKSGGSCQ